MRSFQAINKVPKVHLIDSVDVEREKVVVSSIPIIKGKILS